MLVIKSSFNFVHCVFCLYFWQINFPSKHECREVERATVIITLKKMFPKRKIYNKKKKAAK